MPRRQSDPGLERLWRRRLAQWRRSGLSVRGFCATHGVPEPNFYAWRRELARRDARRAAAGSTPGDAPATVFVPVHITAEPALVPLELVLTGGRILRVPAGFDADTLRRLLATLNMPSEGPPC